MVTSDLNKRRVLYALQWCEKTAVDGIVRPIPRPYMVVTRTLNVDNINHIAATFGVESPVLISNHSLWPP